MKSFHYISAAVFFLNCGVSQALDYKKIEVAEQYTTILKKRGYAVESPSVSDDGTTLIYIGNKLGEKMPPIDMFVKDLNSPAKAETVKKTMLRSLNIFVKGSFTPTGSIVACELEYRPGAIIHSTYDYLKTHEWEPKGYHSVISFYDNNEKKEALDAQDFGLPKGTFLQHPRVSPDQQWLTFYTQDDVKTQGIYLYNFASKKTFSMGIFPDKHPTWSTDGTRIFFHEQGKSISAGDEIARVGYYKIKFENNEASLGERVILSEPNSVFGSSYVYQKHPAFHEGLNLVFFHAQETADGGKTIGVISLDHPEHKPILLKLTFNGQKVKGAEHVTVSNLADSPLYYVGKVNGENAHSLMKLDFAALKEIQQEFNIK